VCVCERERERQLCNTNKSNVRYLRLSSIRSVQAVLKSMFLEIGLQLLIVIYNDIQQSVIQINTVFKT
jgi:hypothetical protein